MADSSSAFGIVLYCSIPYCCASRRNSLTGIVSRESIESRRTSLPSSTLSDLSTSSLILRLCSAVADSNTLTNFSLLISEKVFLTASSRV